MAQTKYDEARQAPLVTNADIENRVEALIGRAEDHSLWLLLLDYGGVQLPQILSFDIGGVTEQRERELGVSNLVAALVDTSVGSVVVVIERPGDGCFTASDKGWARAISSACRTSRLPLAGMLVSHRSAVRWLAPDDFE